MDQLNKIFISIILPIRNEEKFIDKTLDSIIHQNPPLNKADYEILVADGCSDDKTVEIVKKYQNKFSNIILVQNKNKIVPTGFNKALSKSKGNIIIRVDGHSVISDDFISSCIVAFKKIEADCVGGFTEHIAKGFFGEIINLCQTSKFGVGNVYFRNKQKEGKYVDTLAFGAYKRELFKEFGAYDEELVRNQDDEFNFRIIQNKKKIWLDPSIKSKYFARSSLFKLAIQYFQYGFYKVRVIQKRKGIASWRHLIPSTFVLAIIGFTLLFLLNISKVPIFLLLSAYFFANIFSTIFIIFANIRFTLISIFKNVFCLPILIPITFIIIHLSYGIGFLLGLCYYVNSWKNTRIINENFDEVMFGES